MSMKYLQPHEVKSGAYLSTKDSTKTYAYISAELKRIINDRFNSPKSVNIGIDDINRVIRLEFDNYKGAYCISANGTGAGSRICFTQAADYDIPQTHLTDITYGENYIDVRY